MNALAEYWVPPVSRSWLPAIVAEPLSVKSPAEGAQSLARGYGLAGQQHASPRVAADRIRISRGIGTYIVIVRPVQHLHAVEVAWGQGVDRGGSELIPVDLVVRAPEHHQSRSPLRT